jgi:chaperonin GroES
MTQILEENFYHLQETKERFNMNILPTFDRIIVEFDPKEEAMTASGLYVPKSAEEPNAPKKATVLAVGPGRWESGKRVPMSVSPGYRVLLPPYGGVPVQQDGKDCVLFNEVEVLGIFGEVGTTVDDSPE